MSRRRPWNLAAGLNGAAAVIAAALASHAFQDSSDKAAIDAAVTLHLVHAVGLLGLRTIAADSTWFRLTGPLWLLGCVLFSGSLYLIAFLDWTWLGPVTPFGGLAFIAGWLCVAAAGWTGGARPPEA